MAGGSSASLCRQRSLTTHCSHTIAIRCKARALQAVGWVLRLLRLLSVLAKTQNSLPIFQPFLAKNLEKRRVKCAGVRVLGDDFCGTLMGPPRGARKSKKGE